MTWVVRTEAKGHRCNPPMEPVHTDVGGFERCAINSWDDVWKCDDPGCGKYWIPKQMIFPWFSRWEELKGWKLRFRLWRLEKKKQ